MPSRLVALALAAILTAGLVARWREADRRVAENRAGILEYYVLGESLARKGILAYPTTPARPSAFRAPLYPGWLSLRFAGTARPTATSLLRTQAALGAATSLAVYAGGAALSSPAGGLLAAALYALHPDAVAASASLGLEFFYSLSLLAVALALLRWRERATPANAAATGAALGLSLCTRSALALFAVPALLLGLRRRPDVARQAAAFLLPVAISLAPWIARNAIQFREFVPFEKHAATCNLYTASLGRTDTVKGVTQLWDLARREEPGFPAAASAAARYDFLRERAWARIAASPGRYLLASARRLVLSLTVFPQLAAAAALMLLHPAAAAALALPAYFYAAHAALSAEARYFAPLLPVLCLLAGAGVAALISRLTHRRPPAGPSIALGTMTAALLIPLGAAWAAATVGLAREVSAYRERVYAHLGEQSYVGIPVPDLVSPDPIRAAAEMQNAAAMELYVAGDLAGAETAVRRAIAADARWFEPRVSLGSILLARREPAKALAACTDALILLKNAPGGLGPGGQALVLAAESCTASARETLGRTRRGAAR